MKKILILLALIIVTSVSFAQTIASYVGTGGTSTATTGVPNETVSILQTVGFGTNTPCGTGGISGLTNNGVTTYLSTNAHLYFQILPLTGYMINVTGFTAGLRRSNSGLQKVRFAYSLDNGATWIDDGVDHAPNNGGCGTTAVSSWGGGALPTGISSTVNGIIIALYPYDPIAAGGVIQVNTINITGTVVASCITPTAYTVTGGGHYCAGGTGLHVGLSNSDLGFTYQLYLGGVAVGTALTGTGAAIDFGLQTAAGVYTVVATNTVGLCTNNMTGSVTITIDPLPLLYNVTGGGSYCSGGTGLHVGLSGSSVGINYQLYLGGLPIGGAVAGTGSAIDFGLFTGAGTYTVIATDATTGCTANMTGSAVITINPLPSVFAVTGGGSYCAGGAGLPIGIGGSSIGISYQLYLGGVATGTPVSGTGGVLSFGSQTSAGVYTVVATNTTTGCTSNMTGSATITINPTPSPIGGITTLCPGSTSTLTNTLAGGTWTSSTTTVATVGLGTGLVTGLTVGTSTIIYTLATGCQATIIVSVNAITPILGSTNICYHSTNTLSNASAGGTWTSSDPTVASATLTTGDIYGAGVGTATITYTLGTGCRTTTLVTVNPLPAPVTGSTNVCQFLSTTLSDITPGGTWSSLTPTVASVNPFGTVTGVGPGGVTSIRYTLSTGCYQNIFVTVKIPPAPITGTNALCVGNNGTLAEAIGGGVWGTTTPLLGTVDATGHIVGLLAGNFIVTYTIVSCPPATKTVTVNPLPTPILGMSSICAGVSTSLADSSAGGFWTSSNPSVATISSTGLVTVVDTTIGATVNITYTLPTGCFISTPVTVQSSPKNIVGLDSICEGSRTVFTDSTTGGIWTTTNLATAAIVDSTGVLSAIRAGVVNISYTLTSGCFSVKQFIVETPIPASVNITANPGDSVCAGTPITFNASPVNGGIPTYNWRIFYLGTRTDSIGTTFTYTPIHGDVIVCEMVTHGICSVADTVVDTYAVNVYPNVSPGVTIRMNDTTNIAGYYGQIFTFFTMVTYGGPSPTYQWYRNRQAISGATNRSFASAVYQNDTFRCRVVGKAPCNVNTDTAYSDSIIILVDHLDANNLMANNHKFVLYPNPNNGSFIITGNIKSLGNDEVAFQITNILGQVVYAGKGAIRNDQINEQVMLSEGLANGTYILHINAGVANEAIHFDINR